MEARGPAPVTVVVRWQSALPIKQAMAKAKYGNEVESIAEVKEVLQREESGYIIGVANLPQMRPSPDPARLQKALQGVTTLAVKGKDLLRPSGVQMLPTDKSAVIYFLFPKTTPIALEDREVEFSTRLGPMEFKKKFKLREMVFAGKLEL